MPICAFLDVTHEISQNKQVFRSTDYCQCPFRILIKTILFYYHQDLTGAWTGRTVAILLPTSLTNMIQSEACSTWNINLQNENLNVKISTHFSVNQIPTPPKLLSFPTQKTLYLESCLLTIVANITFDLISCKWPFHI